MKTVKLWMTGITLCGAAVCLTSCGGRGEGDDHATQNEQSIEADNGGTMQDGGATDTDTTMMGDTTTTM
ncbi:MAG TPA: hypothetical protein VIG72_12865 [Pontibacter sp.]